MSTPERLAPAAPHGLPRLAFGEACASISHDVDANITTLRQAVPEIDAYEPRGRREDFRQKSAWAAAGDVVLVSNASTPVRVGVGSATYASVSVPRAGGRATCRVDERETELAAGRSAIYFPQACPRATVTDDWFSLLMVRLDEQRLASTIAGMRGIPTQEAAALLPRRSLELPVDGGAVALGALFDHVCGLIDEAGMDSRVLAMLGVDDIVYRTLAAMMLPTLRPTSKAPRPQALGVAHHKRAVDRACGFALEHLTEPLGLTELERVSGLSARSLQLAFQRHFDCTPMEWVREQRLLLARERLKRSNPGVSVTTVAMDCGFTRLSGFSQLYLRRFGELPSETAARARRG